jgi:uncharacterized protein (DUF2252 family)
MTDTPSPAIASLFEGKPSLQDRLAAGRELRSQVPRSSHGIWAPSPNRPDPIDVLSAFDHARLADLVPLRYARMAQSPFYFLRGAAAIMAGDLSATPRTGISVQLCGDAHLANFGTYETPEGNLVFDVNDFDQTLPGPWEWDIKRLASSIVVAGRTHGIGEAVCSDAAGAALRSYRGRMAEFARMRYLDLWYSRVDASAVLRIIPRSEARTAKKTLSEAGRQDSRQAWDKLATVTDGTLRIKDNPPLIVHLSDPRLGDHLTVAISAFLKSLPDDRRVFLSRYTLADFARRTGGVGSVGTRCYIVLLLGRDDADPLFLQLKEADTSVLEAHLGRSAYRNHGQRVVCGQRLMQAASDSFLGWGRLGKTHYYLRHLRTLGGSMEAAAVTPPRLSAYAELCG